MTIRCRFRCLLWGAVLAALLVPASVAAQEPRSVDEKLQALVELIVVQMLRGDMMNEVINAATNHVRARNPDVSERVLDVLAEETKAGFVRHSHELGDFAVSLYRKHFSDSEIEGIYDFYTSPAGRKTLEVMPAIMQDVMVFVTPWAERINGEVMQRTKALLEGEGVRLRL